MTDVDWVATATQDAMVRMLEHADEIELANTDEFTFRAFFMAAARARLGSPKLQTGWKTFDLLVQHDGSATLIEFTYYLHRRTTELDGAPGRRKGGAGLANEAEFRACLAKLRNTDVPGIAQRALVLVYQRDDDRELHRSFHGSYGDPAESASIERVRRLSEGPLEARVLVISPVGVGDEEPGALRANRPHD